MVTNRDHLELSITHRYGIGAAATDYLEKFYDFIVFFEQANERYDPTGIGRFASYAADRVLPRSGPGINDVREAVQEISKAFRLSPRQVERFVTNVALSYLAAREKEFRPAVIVTILAAIKTLDHKLYRKAKSGEMTYTEVADFIVAKEWSQYDAAHMIKVFRFYLDPSIDINSDEWEGFGQNLWNYNLDRTRVISYLANNVLDRFVV